MNSSVNETTDEKLWHYMTLEKFLWLLHDKRPYFRRLTKLQEADKKEGMLPSWLQQLVALVQERLNQEPRDVHIDAKDEADRSYVFCWNKDRCESYLMWAAYGDNGEGVCLQTTRSKMGRIRMMTGPEFGQFYSCEVDYVDHNDTSPEDGIYERLQKPPYSLAQFKSREFKWENELRMVAILLRENIFDEPVTLKDGVHLHFRETPNDGPQFHRMLERVVAGPKMNLKTFTFLKLLIEREFPVPFEYSAIAQR